MPTYNYECDACGHSFEHLQSMLDKKLKKCPKCKKMKLHRLIGSGAGIIFKGNGFYETDYKKKSSSTSPKKTEKKSDSAKCPLAKDSKCSATGSSCSE